MAPLDFDAARKERLRKRDPIMFTLGGETFTCLPFVPFGVAWGLVDTPETPDASTPAAAYKNLATFVADCLIPADVDRWWQLFVSKTEPIDGDTLLEVVNALSAAYTGRPTSPSTGSPAGRRKATGRSKSSPNGKRAVPSRR